MKRINLFLVVLALVGLLGLNPASAQPRGGDHEVLAAASFFRPLGARGGTFNADARYGYFLSDQWQVGLRQSYTLLYDRDASDQWNAVTAPNLLYHFNDGQSTVVPYLGAFVGAVWDDDNFDGTVGPQAGVKFYMSPSTFLSAEYRYEWFFDELDQANEVIDANHVVLLGIGYNWGGSDRRTDRRL